MAASSAGEQQQPHAEHEGRGRVADPPGEPACEAEVAGIEPRVHSLLLPADRRAFLDHGRFDRDEVAADQGAGTHTDRSVEDHDVALDRARDHRAPVEDDHGVEHGAVDPGRTVEYHRGIDRLVFLHDEAPAEHDPFLRRRSVARLGRGGSGEQHAAHERRGCNHRVATDPSTHWVPLPC